MYIYIYIGFWTLELRCTQYGFRGPSSMHMPFSFAIKRRGRATFSGMVQKTILRTAWRLRVMGLNPYFIGGLFAQEVCWGCFRTTSHLNQEPVTMKLWEPTRSVQMPSQDTFKIMECSHGPASVAWSHMWPGPQSNAIPTYFYSCGVIIHDKIE